MKDLFSAIAELPAGSLKQSMQSEIQQYTKPLPAGSYLLHSLASGDQAVVNCAEIILVRWMDAGTTARLVQGYRESQDEELRERIEGVLSRTTSAAALPALMSLVTGTLTRDGTDALLRSALAGISSIGTPEATEFLAQRLGSTTEGVRSPFFTALCGVSSIASRDLLIQILTEHVGEYPTAAKAAAIAALGQFRDEEVYDLLRHQTSRGDQDLRDRARIALMNYRLTPRTATP